MLSFLSRRLARYILPIKIVTLLGTFAGMGYLIGYIPPTISAIILGAVLLFILVTIATSLFVSQTLSLLLGITISFVVFLRAVDLFSPLNLGLFVIFLVLLGLYLHKR